MRALAGILILGVLAGPSTHAEGPGAREQEAGMAEHSGLGKILAAVEYDPQIGRLARVRRFRVKPAQQGAAERILVRVGSDRIGRRGALQLREMIGKSINNKTPHRTVGSVGEADVVLEFEFDSHHPINTIKDHF